MPGQWILNGSIDGCLDGDASEFISRLNSNENPASGEGETWNDAQNEVFLHVTCEVCTRLRLRFTIP